MTDLIYILEDDPEVTDVLRRTLQQSGYRVEAFRRLSDFSRALHQQRPTLALIDLGLPDGDGLRVVTEVLQREGIASIIVTGRGNLTDRVVGLELGADDYIVKPFEPRELLARVRAVLRRMSDPPKGVTPAAKRKQVAEFDGWTADFAGCTLRSPTGECQDLSAAESRLLETFLRASGRVLNRAQLLDSDAGDLEPFDRSIDARISRLRRKLGDTGKSPRYIRTVYGIGYVFTASIAWRLD